MADEIATCQICGRSIKAKRGLIAHHGYQRPGYGWQTSSCLGARFEPYEVSRSRIPQVIKLMEEHRERMATLNETWIASPPEVINYQPRDGWHNPRGPAIELKRPEPFEPMKAIESGSYRMHSYEMHYSHSYKERKQSIVAVGRDLEFLNDRFSSWKAAA